MTACLVSLSIRQVRVVVTEVQTASMNTCLATTVGERELFRGDIDAAHKMATLSFEREEKDRQTARAESTGDGACEALMQEIQVAQLAKRVTQVARSCLGASQSFADMPGAAGSAADEWELMSTATAGPLRRKPALTPLARSPKRVRTEDLGDEVGPGNWSRSHCSRFLACYGVPWGRL